MGGLGALNTFFHAPQRFRSVSAFAPISHPSHPECKWGQKALSGYLGAKSELWARYDPTELTRTYTGAPITILVDQGSADNFLAQGQLRPDELIEAAKENGKVTIDYRLRDGYDHSYFYISTFIHEHIEFHAKAMAQ